MPEISITVKGTENLLKSLNTNKASGPDEISPKLLKELCGSGFGEKGSSEFPLTKEKVSFFICVYNCLDFSLG